MKVRTVTQGRIKPKYNPIPTAREAAHREAVRKHPCAGCGVYQVVVHHLMQDCPGKRWRRDHRFQVPLCDDCHAGKGGVHDIGEPQWCIANGVSLPLLAARLERASIAMGILTND